MNEQTEMGISIMWEALLYYREESSALESSHQRPGTRRELRGTSNAHVGDYVENYYAFVRI